MERQYYDPNAPQGAADLSNLINVLRSLHQGDFMPLRPRASLSLDDFEYPTTASIAAVWVGTGVTVTAEGTTKKDGNFGMKAVIDATDNRAAVKTHAIDIDAFVTLKVWIQCTAAASAIQFYIVDGSANESYWDITTHASKDTWEQESLTLASPDSNNGTDAELDDVASYGFKALDASETYYIDTLEVVCGLNVAVETSHPGSYYKNIYVSSSPLESAIQSSPALVAPSANPRIDILCVDSSGVLTWVAGDEAGTPVAKWASLDSAKMPICLVYCKTTMTSVLDYEDKDTDANQGYIYADCRPTFMLGGEKTLIQDADQDTKWEAEKNADEDILRGTTGGTQRAQIDSNGLTLASGASVNELSTDTSLAGNSDDAVPTEKAVKTYIDARLPSGMIMLWSGSEVTIPTGWVICDGTNSTPDLTDKFIVGAGDAYAVAATGGENTHQLTEAEMPSHTHTMGWGDGTGSTGKVRSPGQALTIKFNPATSSKGSDDAHENRPPYYALCYIMKS